MAEYLPAEIADAVLRIESQTFVRQVDWFAELGSTNDHALSIAAQSELVLPRLIWAERQQAGRGRSGHAWWSAPGALTFSLLIDARDWRLEPDRWPLISLLTGLAVADALSEFVGEAAIRLKWPNDVLLDEHKVCGILVEPARTDTARIVVGIGVNVGNSFVDAPPELRSIATALCDHLDSPVPPVAVLLAILDACERRFNSHSTRIADLEQDWKRRCYLTDHQVRVTAGDRTLTGVCRGIDSRGALLLETPQGMLRQVSGTVRRVD